MTEKTGFNSSIGTNVYKILSTAFSLEEVHELCFELQIADDEITGSTRNTKARSLVQWLERRENLPELTNLIKTKRPKLASKVDSIMVGSINISNEAEVQNQLQDLLKAVRKQEFVVLLVGTHGVGKSSTVNSLMNKVVASVDALQPETRNVVPHKSEQDGINYTFYDTPGLCDDLPSKQNDKEYLQLVKSNVKEIDSFWFVAKLNDRLRLDERRAIRLITQAFGVRVWDRCVLVLTRADEVQPEDFEKIRERRTEIIREQIASYTSPERAKLIPSVAVTNISTTTPDGNLWLGKLYTQMVVRMSQRGLVPFLLMTASRVVIRPEKQKTLAVSSGGSSRSYSRSSSQNSPSKPGSIVIDSKKDVNAIKKAVQENPQAQTLWTRVQSAYESAKTTIDTKIVTPVRNFFKSLFSS